MAVTLTTAARNAACDAIVDLIDAGSGAGYIEFQESDDSEVATLPFSATAFGAASSGVATAAAITNDSAATGGTAAKFRFYDSDATEVLAGSLGTSGEDINLNTLTISASDVVSISSLTVTMPATPA